MSNLDYEVRMSALNQLIHETLGVSLNTVRSAYGRARNTSITVHSSASTTGNAPVSVARPTSLASISNATDTECAPTPAHAVLDRIPRTMRAPFLHRLKQTKRLHHDSWIATKSDALPMHIFSGAGADDDAGAFASDWHKLRNEFWHVAQADSNVMDRYMREVLG